MANSLDRTIKAGETVVLKNDILKSEFNTLEGRTVEIVGEYSGNFGFASGTMILVRFFDGEEVRMSGYDIDRQATEALLLNSGVK